MLKNVASFIGSASLVAILAFPLTAEARYRTFDGHGCRAHQLSQNYQQLECPVIVGSDFNARNINLIEVDGYTQGYVEARACRQSYGGTTVSCGATYTRWTAGMYNPYIDVAGMRDGSPYDYRFVSVVQTGVAGDTLNGTVYGVFVNTSDAL